MFHPSHGKLTHYQATIYGKSKRYPFYRIVYRVDGKRRMKSIAAYSEARDFADAKVRELAEGSKVPALTDKQAGDALAALQRLQSLYQSTGRRISLLAGISEYCEANAKLGERPLSECVDSYTSQAMFRAEGTPKPSLRIPASSGRGRPAGVFHP